jgi:glycosyltransferase involved in cell wall biosynthesis
VTGRALGVALVDASFFTIPYDARLAGALGALGHDVTVYGEARLPGEMPSEFADVRPLFYPELLRLGLRNWPHRAVRIAKGALHWRAMRRLAGELRAAPPDIIHFQWLPLPAIDRLFLRELRRVAPLVLTAHDSTPFNGTSLGLQNFGAIGILREFDAVIVHTEEARERLLSYGVAPDRLVRIAHGRLHDMPDGAAPRAAPDGDKVRFLLFGKLRAYKGADVLIEAYRRLPPEFRARVEVHIVGKPYMDVDDLRRAAEELGDGIRLDLRFVPDEEMTALLAEADAIVFPYRAIDISGVLMAALNHARPIIASRIGGFAELLTDGRHGVLVPPGDADALAAAMARLCAEPETRRAMGMAVAELGAAIPGWDQIARRTAELYDALLRRRG